MSSAARWCSPPSTAGRRSRSVSPRASRSARPRRVSGPASYGCGLPSSGQRGSAVSDDVRERGCEQYSNDLAELALGVLTGRERAQVLAHVESCPRCADELEHLSRVADTVVQSAPEMEPPLGFEVRLFERMGVTDVRPRRRRFRPSRWVPAAVGVAAAALVLGLGLSLTSSSAPTVAAQRRTDAAGGDGGLGGERRDGRARRDRRRPRALDVDDAWPTRRSTAR